MPEMVDITAKDVQALRKASGVGMMDAKKALVENDGDFDKAVTWLREKGLSKAAERSDRANTQGAVTVARIGDTAALVELNSETDFVAKSPEFLALLDTLAAAVVADGEGAIAAHQDAVDDLRITLKENIAVGRVIRFETPAGSVLHTYEHRPSGWGVNAVMVELEGGNEDLAKEVALHIAFAKPQWLSRHEVPAERVAEERQILESMTRNEGKPEAALPKIVEGRLIGFFKEHVLLDQDYVKDTKVSIGQLLGDAKITRFAQVAIGR
ncbi:MAG TPA: translation elongation factor Ts [Acidimicrobiales bacterium]|nr:translation elongation factor Ts [Acidimicrobiales bacterium]